MLRKPSKTELALVVGAISATIAVMSFLGVSAYLAKPDLMVDFGVMPWGQVSGSEIDTTYRTGSGSFEDNFIITISNVGDAQATDIKVSLQAYPQNGWFDFKTVKPTLGIQTSAINSNEVTIPRILKGEKMQFYFVVDLTPSDYDDLKAQGITPYVDYRVASANEKFEQRYYVNMHSSFESL